MEEAVGERVRFQPGHSVDRAFLGAGDHVVPLQDLVEDDAVHESAEGEAEQNRGRADTATLVESRDSLCFRLNRHRQDGCRARGPSNRMCARVGGRSLLR